MLRIPHDIIVEVELPDEIVASLFRIARLDGIGPGRFARIDQLVTARFRQVK
jgi:hypothetical protein